MKAFRSVLFLGLSMAVVAGGGKFDGPRDQAVEASASVSEALTTSSPPKLLRAQESQFQEGDSVFWGLTADIMVPHVGSTKAVRVLGHNRLTGASFTFKASYNEAASTGNELWQVRARLDVNPFEPTMTPIDVMVEQVIDGVRTVDDNGGSLYILSAATDPSDGSARYVRSKFVLADRCVAPESSATRPYFTYVGCTLDLNPAVPRGGQLTMTYTAGSKAQKTKTVACGTNESCSVNVSIPASTTFKFRLTYVVRGTTYFDDNFGQSYVIDTNHPVNLAHDAGWTSNGAGRSF